MNAPPRRIKNTATAFEDDPVLEGALLLEAMATGSADSFIERQERDGQQQLVNSDRLPSDCGDHAPWLALGFTFGDPDPSDPLFMPATLPPGWTRQGSDHAMWSYLHDELGRQRAGIFYKAAFYDRRASMHLTGLSWYVTRAVEYDGPPLIFDDKWATRDAVLASMTKARDDLLAEAADFRRYAADEHRRDEKNRAQSARFAAEKEDIAAKYGVAMTALTAEDES